MVARRVLFLVALGLVAVSHASVSSVTGGKDKKDSASKDKKAAPKAWANPYSPVTVYQRFVASYHHEEQLAEKRTKAGTQPVLPFVSVPILMYAAAFYLGLTFFLHSYMKQRSAPFACKSFKSILLVYNFTCVLAAGYVVWGIGYALINVQRKFVCNALVPADAAGEEKHYAGFLAHVFWVFYAQKFWEFLDTWFFLLRKSFRQVTFLHVFHHCSICIVVGLILPFDFNGDMYLPILLNAVVHVLMYSHYLVSALGMSTPWKPYLTSMQLLQFVLIATQSALSLSRGDSCGAPYFAKVIMVVYMGSMLVLFGNFFLHSYVLKKPSTTFGAGVVKKREQWQQTKTHSGRVTLDDRGAGTVQLPLNFANGELTYQVTPIGRPMPNLHVSDEQQTQEQCCFTLSGGVPNKAVSYTVTMVLMGEKPKPPPPSCCMSPHATEFAQPQPRSGTPRGRADSIDKKSM